MERPIQSGDAEVAEGIPTTAAPAAADYVEDFEFVWSTIDERFYDPEFGEGDSAIDELLSST